MRCNGGASRLVSSALLVAVAWHTASCGSDPCANPFGVFPPVIRQELVEVNWSPEFRDGTIEVAGDALTIEYTDDVNGHVVMVWRIDPKW